MSYKLLTKIWFVILVGAVLLAGCQPASTPTLKASATPLPPTPTPTHEPTPAPTPIPIPIYIMPMGDSITEGICDSPENCNIPYLEGTQGTRGCSWALNDINPKAVGYRQFLKDKLKSNGIPVEYVGSVKVVDGLAHEGHSGWTVRQLDYCVQKGDWFQPIKPDMILLHIGTNDSGLRTPELILKDLEQLINHIYEKLPKKTIIIVAKIIRGHSQYVLENDTIAKYNGMIPELVDQFHDVGMNIYYVDMSSAIHSDADFDWIGVHPSLAASERMAEIWLSRIIEILDR